MRLLRLAGDHRSMGRQQAAQASSMRGELLRVVEVRLADWGARQAELASIYEAAIRRYSPATAEMLEGIADGFDIDVASLWRYAASGWVAEWTTHGAGPLAGEGCTAWAVGGQAALDGEPLLAKNRDYYKDHRELQVLCEGAPHARHRWLAVGSVGSPGVFSSGMNERGLVIADTHVATLDLGAGVPRYAQMLEVLERCESVPEALELLAAAPASGGGNLVIADTSGRLATCELTYGRRILKLAGDVAVATNHFTTAAMRPRHVRQGGVFGPSVARRARVAAVLRRSRPVDVRIAETLLARHGTSDSAVCRHTYPTPASDYGTISSVIYLPRRGEARVAGGWPCLEPFRRLVAGVDFWEGATAVS